QSKRCGKHSHRRHADKSRTMTSCAHALGSLIFFIDSGRHIVTTAIGFANPVFGLHGPGQLLGRADELIEWRASVRLTALGGASQLERSMPAFRGKADITAKHDDTVRAL
ncbi:MAG: hypothetical protein WCB50_20935, partial [Pseudolabrys sp.]